LKRLETAKSPAPPRLRLSGESSAKRSFWFRLRFVSFRLISPAFRGCRARRRTPAVGPVGAGSCGARRRSRRSLCGRLSLATARILF
jgi:hypothetical protein